MSVQVTAGAGSLMALGIGISDVATLFALSKRVGNWLSASSGDKEFLQLLDQDEVDLLRRGGLIDTNRFNKRWSSEIFLLANSEAKTFKGEIAENALETLGKFTSLMVSLVAALDAFCLPKVVKAVIRNTLLEVLGLAEYGEDVVASQYIQRINAWRSSATVRGISAEARRIRRTLISTDAIVPGLMPSGDIPHMVKFLVWLITDKSEQHITPSSDVAGVGWCLSQLGVDVLGVRGLGFDNPSAPIQLEYLPDATWLTPSPQQSPLARVLERRACTTVNLDCPHESLSKFPVDAETANRSRAAWIEGQKAAKYVACRPLVPSRELREENNDFEYVIYDAGSETGRVATEIHNLISSLGFAVNNEICKALERTMRHEVPSVLDWLHGQTMEGPQTASSIQSPDMKDDVKVNAFTIFQAFFMGYYYGIFLNLVDTSMLGLRVVDGSWGFRNAAFFCKMSGFYLVKSRLKEPGLRCLPRETMIEILSALLLGSDMMASTFEKPVYSRNSWCLGFVDKRALLASSLLQPCVTLGDIGRFVLVDADVSGIPVGIDGLVRPGVPDSLKHDGVDGQPTVPKLLGLSEGDGQDLESGSSADVTFHIEADWDGDPSTMLLCVRYRGRRIQTINPATADANFLKSLVRPAQDLDKKSISPDQLGQKWTIADFFTREPERGTRNEPTKLFMAVSRMPRLRYFITEAYSAFASVTVLVDSLEASRGALSYSRQFRVSRVDVILDGRGHEAECGLDDWYPKKIDERMTELKANARFDSGESTTRHALVAVRT
ncbi:hypothetical protein QQZ08_004631 [Neonectria magnoliae]|uniref:Uncharacterized protein n=1 Tax=Neonectria magnoliae TaxID=2732573 RepID=A0ABR1I5S7_9HYPO